MAMDNIFTCELCHNEYEYYKDREYFSRYVNSSIKVCPECDAILPGEGKYLLRCRRCDHPFKAYHNNFKYCPICREERKVFTCELCSQKYIHDCEYLDDYINNIIKVCDDCKTKLPGEGDNLKHCKNCNALFKTEQQATRYCPDCCNPACEICHNRYKCECVSSKIKVCNTCKAVLPGKGRSIKRCDDCGTIFKGSINLCPNCYMPTCEICHKQYKAFISRDRRSIKTCPECEAAFPGEGRNILKCRSCNSFFKSDGSTTVYCPICDERRRTFTCEVCHKEYVYNGNLQDYIIHICESCKTNLPGSGRNIKYCERCNTLFKTKSGAARICPICAPDVLTCEICHSEYDCIKGVTTIINVCPDCTLTLPGKGRKIFECKSCNALYRSYRATKVGYCPNCDEKRRTFTCEMCCQEYIYRGDMRYCSIKVCDSCKATLLGEGSILKRCNSCKTIFKAQHTASVICPNCRTFTCEMCGNEYEYDKRNVNRYAESFIKVCPKCVATLPGDSDKNILRCKGCGVIFKAYHNGFNYCPTCREERKVFTCQVCNQECIYEGDRIDDFIKMLIKVCESCKINLSGDGNIPVKCKDCSLIFKANSNNVHYCPTCRRNRRTFTCELCNGKYVYNGNLQNYTTHICDACKGTLPGEGDHVKRCSNCEVIFKGATKLCPDCLRIPKESNTDKYCSLIDNGWIEDEGNGIIIEDIPESERGEAECEICQRGFISEHDRSYCKHCYRVFNCGTCGEKFVNYRRPLATSKYCSVSCASNDYIERSGEDVNYMPVDVDICEVQSGVAGVWGLYDENDNLLDVAQTIDIAGEWRSLSSKFTKLKFITMRDNGINLDTLKGKVVVFEDDLVKRLEIEEDFALSRNALYWHPQPYTFQSKNRNDLNNME